jgi:hypothetical protein
MIDDVAAAWTHDLSRAMSRRDFSRGSVRPVPGSPLPDCAHAVAPQEMTAGSSRLQKPGNVAGLVSTLEGVAQPGLGTLILMNGRGRQTGRRSSPDANGRFSFSAVTPGDYQLRFNAPGLRSCRSRFRIRFDLPWRRGRRPDVPVRVQVGNYNQNLVEI